MILKLVPRRTAPSGRREKTRFRALKHDAGQPAGRKRPGVDVDPVRWHLGSLARRVPMNDDPAEIRPAVEKLIPNPQQVFDALALQRNARAARPHDRGNVFR